MSPGFERYSVGWTDARGVYGSGIRKGPQLRYGEEAVLGGYKILMTQRKVDDHKYTTEAKDLPIEACVSMWVIKYGNEAVSMQLVNEQDPLMWEIGNRLWWADRLEYNQNEDTFTCKS